MDEIAPAPAGSSALHHTHYLSHVIGPRGSTTPQEAQAVEYARQVLESEGLKPAKETFSSATSAWRPYAMIAALALTIETIFLFGGDGGAIIAAMSMAFLLGLVLLEIASQDNLLRWVLPKSHGQNVWARLSPSSGAAQRVVLIGHLDSHRTPKLFSTPAWQRAFGWLMPAGLLSMAASLLLFILSIYPGGMWWRALSMLPALIAWWISVLTFEADYTPYTAGANDNATGAGVVLSLAARLKEQPLQNIEVWVLCSSCAEVGGYGTADFLARHRDELISPADRSGGQPGSAYCITLNAVGGSGTHPCYLTHETFLTTTPSDPELLRLADELAARRPELGAQRTGLSGTYTEGRIAARSGLRTLTLVNVGQDGSVPHWRQATDTFENVDEAAVRDTETFVWELLQALDAQQTPLPPPPAETAPPAVEDVILGPEDEGG